MTDITKLISKINNGYNLPTIEDLVDLRNGYEHQIEENFSNQIWLRSQKILLDQLFDCIGNYRASVLDKHVEKILWASEIKKYMMCVDVFIHYPQVRFFSPETGKKISIIWGAIGVILAAVYMNPQFLHGVTFGMLTGHAIDNLPKPKNIDKAVVEKLVDNYNFILYQVKDALSQLGITGDNAVRVFNMKQRGELSKILGQNKYDNLASHFQLIR